MTGNVGQLTNGTCLLEEVNKFEDPIDSDDDSLDGRTRADHENLRCGLEQLPHRNVQSRISSESDVPNDYDIKQILTLRHQ